MEFFPNILWLLYAFPNVKVLCTCRAGRYEVDGYVYNAADEPKILMTGKLNEALSYQVCDLEGEPLPGTEMKEVGCLIFVTFIPFFVFFVCERVHIPQQLHFVFKLFDPAGLESR